MDSRTQTRSNGTADGAAFSALAIPSARLAALSRWAEADEYEFERLIRRTPSTDVYLAFRRATGGCREVLVVHDLPGVDVVALRRAVEAQVFAARAVKHPGVAPVEDAGFTSDGRLYVATARPAGRLLSEILAEDGALPVRRALDLGLQIADAVAAAHELTVVHGRITTDSVVVVPRQVGRPERAVVLGFGTAAAQDAVRLIAGVAPEGPQPFASPERAAGGPPTLRDDVFGLGSVILSMLAGGRPPVVRASAGQTRPTAADPAPKDAIQVLQRARMADPARRYVSGRDLRDALKAVANTPIAYPAVAHPLAADEGAAAMRFTLQFPIYIPPRDVRTFPGLHFPGVRAPSRRALLAAGVTGILAASGAAFAWNSRPVAAFSSPLDATAHVPGQPTLARPTQSSVAAALPARAPVDTAVPRPPDPAVTLATAPPTARGAMPGNTMLGAEHAAARSVASAPLTAPAQVTGAVGAGALGASVDSAAPPSRITVTASAAGDVVASPPAVRAVTAGTRSPDAPNTEAARTEAASSAAGVRAALAEYAQAIETRDLESLKRVYPGMTESQRRAWATFFGAVGDLRARLVVADVTTTGATAQARVRGTYEYQNLRPHRAERSPVSFTATLAREASGWRVRTVE